MFLKFQVNRLAIVVQLLLGEIPDRKTFREAILKKTLVPYYSLTQGIVHLIWIFSKGGWLCYAEKSYYMSAYLLAWNVQIRLCLFFFN